jgi:ribonuclease D
VMSDSVIVELANHAPTTAEELNEVRELRPARRHAKVWLEAIRKAQALPESALPPLTLPGTGPPPPRAWPDRDPVAAARLAQAREGIAAFGAEHTVPVENLLTPDILRRLIWSPPADLSEAGIAATLTALGARPWQVAITAPIIAQACAAVPPPG